MNEKVKFWILLVLLGLSIALLLWLNHSTQQILLGQ